jgi:hypothetical protein
MEAAAARSRGAVGQLRIAEDYRRRRPYKYCWYTFLALLVSTIVIALILSI